jgi:hypothetical protein
MTSCNSSWWRHDANMTTDLRFAKLHSMLKVDPYGLICRLYDLAATIQQDGDTSKIDDGAFALRLEFAGTGRRLRKLLTEAGYLTEAGIIVDWRENLFRLYAATREQNRERGLKSAAKRAEAKVASDSETDITEHNITATVERPVERSVETFSNEWVSLPPVLATGDFKAAWNLWLQYRRESKFKTLKPTSIATQWRTLAGWGHAVAIAQINESIRQGWQGIFPPKAGAGPAPRPDALLKTPTLTNADAAVVGRIK